MEKIEKLYFINLDRRYDREEHFLNQCVKEKIPINKITKMRAIDGLIHNFTNDEMLMFSKTNYINELNCNATNIIKKIMGNQLSHYYLLKEIITANQQLAIICQDDSVLIPNFMDYIEKITLNLPSDAEIINIGLHKRAVESYSEPWDLNENDNDFDKIGKQVINEYICTMKPELNPCSLAYIVTLEGAKNIITYFENNGFLSFTDFNFNEYLLRKDIFYGSNKILITGNPKLGSDIFC